jgi:hypothetical protein
MPTIWLTNTQLGTPGDSSTFIWARATFSDLLLCKFVIDHRNLAQRQALIPATALCYDGAAVRFRQEAWLAWRSLKSTARYCGTSMLL